jgi:large subunit ribosomal protein L24
MRKITEKLNNVTFHVKKGDTVFVLAGDDKGKRGVVLEILKEKNRVIVEGINIVTKHVKPTANEPEGGIKKIPAGVHISNLMVVEPKTGEPTRIGRRRNESGKLKRYSKKTQEFID